MSRRKRKKSPVAVICSALGTAMLLILVVICIPLTIPRMMGYEIYSVISGSMEPALPVGSLVYIGREEPKNIEKDEVIAFYGAKDSNAIITHRVVENRVVMGEFITKGDANKTNDMNAVPYGNFIGKVEFSLPVLGYVAQLITSIEGKIVAGAVILVALVLQIIASAIEKRRE
ncbi:signal peptidase I [Blautia sp. Marseille-P3201T]|uniref:signal peptidase I n=1 Tax=Blautia sp. Marseille-P3201T TaxID=1907659 RepID=UPI0009F812A2|nr:signal peptidase I [Blautia sp. Marseille-P3201T]